jgi:hypothetical protein
MKTILTRMKTLVTNNKSQGQTLSYVKNVEICHPEISMLELSESLFPSVFLIPGPTRESWEASQIKLAEHQVIAFLVLQYNQREQNVIGDETRPQGKGILDFENDFMTVFRGHRLAISGEPLSRQTP